MERDVAKSWGVVKMICMSGSGKPEFCLEDWLEDYTRQENKWSRFIPVEKVKEFIGLLKEELVGCREKFEPIIKELYPCFSWNILDKVDELAGEGLV